MPTTSRQQTKTAAKAAIKREQSDDRIDSAEREQARRAVGKAPAPRGKKKTHTKPATPKEAKQAEKVTETMYQSLTAPGAPKASPQGYIMGATMVLKLLIDQAVEQGEDRDALKAQALTYIAAI